MKRSSSSFREQWSCSAVDLLEGGVVTITAFDGERTFNVPIALYPNNEPLVRFDTLGGQPLRKVMIQQTNLADFMAALFFLDAYAERRGNPMPQVLIPCPPGMRQDRLIGRWGADYLFTAKSVAREINARNFPRVTIVDPHSDVFPALLDRADVVEASDLPWNAARGPWDAVVAPDAGATRRALKVAQKLAVPLLQAGKRRSPTTGALAGFWVEPILAVEPMHLLVVDDLCDGGGTFLGLAEVLKPHTADLYVTHGLFTKGTKALAKAYQRIITTDSVPCRLLPDEPMPTIVPVAAQFLKGEPWTSTLSF